MSAKIKSKDLSYDSTLPPFLQRLRSQHTGQGDADRHERPIARPKRAKDPNDDDGPTVVDESGDILSRDEFQKLTGTVMDSEGSNRAQGEPNSKAEGSTAANDFSKISNELDSKRNQVLAGGALPKKRKAAKVIRDENSGDGVVDEGASEKKIVKKPKKKAKAIKLAFDDEGS